MGVQDGGIGTLAAEIDKKGLDQFHITVIIDRDIDRLGSLSRRKGQQGRSNRNIIPRRDRRIIGCRIFYRHVFARLTIQGDRKGGGTVGLVHRLVIDGNLDRFKSDRDRLIPIAIIYIQNPVGATGAVACPLDKGGTGVGIRRQGDLIAINISIYSRKGGGYAPARTGRDARTRRDGSGTCSGLIDGHVVVALYKFHIDAFGDIHDQGLGVRGTD